MTRWSSLLTHHWMHGLDQLQQCWTIPGAEPGLKQRLLQRQVGSLSINAWIGDVILFMGACMAIAADPEPPDWGPWWLLALLLWIGGNLRLRLQSSAMQTDIRLWPMIADRIVTSTLFMVGMDWLYLYRGDNIRVVVGGVVVAALCGGAVRYARTPQIGLTNIVVIEIFCCAVLLWVGRRVDLLITIGLLGYSLSLKASILSTSRQFVRSCQAEFEAEREKEMVQLLLKDLEGASSDWFWESDTQGQLKHVSERLADIVQTRAELLRGQSLLHLLEHVHAQPQAQAQLQHNLGNAKPFRDLVIPIQPDSGAQWWSVSAKPMFDVNGHWIGWRGVGIDVTAAFHHEQSLQHIATTDALTGLVNRHGFNQFLHIHLDAGPLALLILDLDQFKAVNDAHGHTIGDNLLRAVARRLEAACDESMCLARLGGDEYALILPGEHSPQALQTRGEALLQLLHQPFHLGPLRLEMRASIGGACAPQQANSAVDLQRAADMALYAAKAAGRDLVRLYDTQLGEQEQTRAMMVHDLAHALERQEFRLEYQLVVNARTGQAVGAEALLRWSHPQHGPIAPLDFIPLAEDSGQILSLGAWVLRQACLDAMQWPQPLTVAVNLSALQLRSRDLVQQVAHILAETGLPPQRLELELTETVLADHNPDTTRTLEQLRALGLRLSLDDFGTGFSSLAYLQHFGFDCLKIDRSFIQALTDVSTPRAATLTEAIVGLARALGLSCTAEGVEHPEQMRRLQQMGCTSLQGHLFAPPMPMIALTQRLRQAA